MKLYSIIIKLLLICFIFSCHQDNENNIFELQYKNNKVINIIPAILQENFNKKFDYIYMNIKEINNLFIIRISFLKEIDIKYNLMKIRKELYGYYNYNNKTIFIYGNGAIKFFSKSKEYRNFSFLNINLIENEKKRQISPPEVFDPYVWVYEFKNENIKFLTNDFNLFEDDSLPDVVIKKDTINLNP